MPGTNRPGSDPAGPFRPAVDSIANFFDYQFNPEKYAKPGQRVKPGLAQGYKYDLQPGESYDDVGQVRDASGQPVEFINRPKLSTLADLIGNMTGGIAGAPKGAIGAGAYRRVRDIGPSLYADDPSVAHDLALKMEAMHKRGAQGYKLPSSNSKEALDKADKALTRVSTTDPLPRYQGAAQRALDFGFDIPAFHVTNAAPDPEVIRKLTGAPWSEMDPFFANRGAMYFGNFENPTGPLRSHAALNTGGDTRAYPFLLKDVLGESPLPPGLHHALPDTLQFDKWGGLPQGTIADIRAGMQEVPGWGDNMGAAMEAAKERFGKGFDPGIFAEKQGSARNQVAELISRLYYQPVPGEAPGLVGKTDPFAFRPAHAKDPHLPHYSTIESGAASGGLGKPGLRFLPPVQNELGAAGFSGVRVRDEQTPYGFKSYAMFDPTGVRAVGAKFKDPMGDLLSSKVPYPWLAGFNVQGQENQ